MNNTRKMKRDLKQKYNAYKDLFKIIKHYFPDFIDMLSSISDPRHQSYITYSQVELIFVRMFGFFSHCQSMRHMNETFNCETFIDNCRLLFDETLDEVPHGDTINYYLKDVHIGELRNIIYGMVRDLLKKRFIDDFRINKKYYHVIMDGVQIYSYDKDHINGSIKIVYDDEHIRYHTNMLVAVIERDNMVIPLDFEPIENVGIVYDKQDCEINAAKRMMKRIKQHFKRLPICISGDALYFNEPMIKMIEGYQWTYMITYKEGCTKEVNEYYEIAKKYNDVKIKEENEETYEYYNDIHYRDIENINMIKLKMKDKEFCYVTNIKITDYNYKKMMEIGRKRWKIENKGFNDLTNHGYHMKHAYSYDENAIKGHYAIMLISHLIMQLLEMYERNHGRFETIRQLGEEIKEALRNRILSAQDIKDLSACHHLSRINLQLL